VSGAILAGAGVAVYGVSQGWGAGRQALSPRSAPATVLATSVVLCIATVPGVSRPLGASAEIVDSLRLASVSALNRRDAEQFQRGYYENLLEIGRFNDELWKLYEQMPADFVRSLSRLGLVAPTGDERDYDLVPLKEGVFVGAMVRTNRWGMRDRDYELERPGGTYRIAVLGPSTAMASGVDADAGFEAVLERRLNENGADRALRYEVLNFGVAGYAPLHALYQLRKKVPAFEPNMAMYIGHASDLERTSSQFVRMIYRRILPADPYLQRVRAESGIRPRTMPNEARRRLKPYTEELLTWTYRGMVATAREHGMDPVYVYLETVTEPLEPWRAEGRQTVISLARAAGFKVLDLTGVFADYQPSDLWIAVNDGHANALGNRLIGERLHMMLRRDDLQLALAP
jgi:hypothetical protein